jgi:hypothetical protein
MAWQFVLPRDPGDVVKRAAVPDSGLQTAGVSAAGKVAGYQADGVAPAARPVPDLGGAVVCQHGIEAAGQAILSPLPGASRLAAAMSPA